MKYVLPLACVGILLSGCAAPQGDFNWVTHTWTTGHGVFALDHISRNKVDVAKAVARPYLGETYYFENEANATVFERNPWAFLYVDNSRGARPERSDWN